MTSLRVPNVGSKSKRRTIQVKLFVVVMDERRAKNSGKAGFSVVCCSCKRRRVRAPMEFRLIQLAKEEKRSPDLPLVPLPFLLFIEQTCHPAPSYICTQLSSLPFFHLVCIFHVAFHENPADKYDLSNQIQSTSDWLSDFREIERQIWSQRTWKMRVIRGIAESWRKNLTWENVVGWLRSSEVIFSGGFEIIIFLWLFFCTLVLFCFLL